MTIDFEIYSGAHQRDPYRAYRELRDHAPVHRCPESGSWCLSRYDDVLWGFKNPQLLSSKMDHAKRFREGGLRGAARGLKMGLQVAWKMKASPRTMIASRMLINEDGDPHAMMRNIVNRGFTPRRVSDWEPRVRAIVDECMGGLAGSGSFDLVQSLAIPLPVTVIAEVLGIEPSQREEFKRWSDVIIEGSTGSARDQMLESGVLDGMAALRAYLRPIVRQRRAHPAEDLISLLVRSQDETAALSDYEIYLFVLLLLVAGNETTTNLLGNAVDALYEHPDQLELVSQDPSRIPDLVEETLRYDAPVQFLMRTVLEDIELHGVTIPAGDEVALIVGSANRDERRFHEPDRLDIDRDTRGHLGFGFGAHFCLGASLARLEAKAALEALVPRLPSLARESHEPEFLDSFQIRGRARLVLEAA